MTATNGHNTGRSAVVSQARPVVLLRYRPGLAPETARWCTPAVLVHPYTPEHRVRPRHRRRRRRGLDHPVLRAVVDSAA
ncbi:MAG: hypothetical protein ACRDSP_18990 [Pseudonocardiaceae bacterium]